MNIKTIAKEPDNKFKTVIKLGKKFLVIVFLFYALLAKGQLLNYSNEFLKIGATARGISMGNSIVTSSQGAEAVFYNPANIANLSNPVDLTITHSEYFNNLASYDYAAFAYKSKNLAIGAGFVRLGVDNIPNTLSIYNNGTFDPSLITYFSASDNALFVSIAHTPENFKNLTFGYKAKLIYRHLGSFVNGYGFGFDLGLTYKNEKYLFSALVRDITTTFTAWFYNLDDTLTTVLTNTGNDIPKNSVELTAPSIVVGLSRKFELKNDISLLTEAGLITEWSGASNYLINLKKFSSTPQIGMELSYKNSVHIRGGLYNFQRVEIFGDSTNIRKVINAFPTFGLGFRYKNFYLDYSLQNFANKAVALQSHFITVRFTLNNLKGILPKSWQK